MTVPSPFLSPMPRPAIIFILLKEEVDRLLMRGTSRLRCVATNFRPIHSSKGGWVGTITPRKQTDDSAGEARVEKEKAEPIVAFSRPPQLPPFIGPLIALWMLESWTRRDNNDD